jgi:hypothetical protein
MSTTRNIIEGIKNVTSEGVTKAQVGLGSVDNTTDANKPVSTATQTALNGKAPIASPVFTGDLRAERLIAYGSGGIDSNVAVGPDSLRDNTTGGYNTATGRGTLVHNTTGNHNTALGIYAQHNIVGTSFNTAVGYASLYSSTSGELNTAFGSNALRFKQNGGANTDLSYCTGLGSETRVGGNNATAIGCYASAPANCVALGTSNERTLVGGAVDNGVDRLQVNGSISAYNATIRPYDGGTHGARVFGVASYFTNTAGERYIHIKLPSRYTLGNNNHRMFHLHIQGYALQMAKVIDVTVVGYVYSTDNVLIAVHATDIAGAFSPTAYSSTTGETIVRLHFPTTYYTSIVVDTMRVGNGDIIAAGELTIIESTEATL